MDPEPPAVGDLDPSLEIDPGFLSDNIGTLPPLPDTPYTLPGQVGYAQGSAAISYQHSFQHHSSALHQQQPPLSLPLHLSQDVQFEDDDTMQQSSDQKQSAEQPTFTITATGEFKCTDGGCKTQPVFKRKCDLTKHQNNHRRPRECPKAIEGCDYKGGAELKDLHRHLWSHHRKYAEDNKIPKEETMCDYPGCNYKGRKDNVRRHKDNVGHHRVQP